MILFSFAMPKASTFEARTFDHRHLRLRPMQPKAAQGGSTSFFTHFKVKTAIRCHPCHLVATRNTLIIR